MVFGGCGVQARSRRREAAAKVPEVFSADVYGASIDFKRDMLQVSKTLVDDDFEFEYAIRFLCGERNTAAMKMVESLVEKKEEELCKPSEGEPASAKDVEDLIQERVKVGIQRLQRGENPGTLFLKSGPRVDLMEGRAYYSELGKIICWRLLIDCVKAEFWD